MYECLGRFNGCYMNQDYDIWADTLPEVLDVYAEREGLSTSKRLMRDMELFLKENQS